MFRVGLGPPDLVGNFPQQFPRWAGRRAESCIQVLVHHRQGGTGVPIDRLDRLEGVDQSAQRAGKSRVVGCLGGREALKACDEPAVHV